MLLSDGADCAFTISKLDFTNQSPLHIINELRLKSCDQELGPSCQLCDYSRDSTSVLTIQSMVKLIKNIERCRLHLQHSEEHRYYNDGLLAT